MGAVCASAPHQGGGLFVFRFRAGNGSFTGDAMTVLVEEVHDVIGDAELGIDLEHQSS